MRVALPNNTAIGRADIHGKRQRQGGRDNEWREGEGKGGGEQRREGERTGGREKYRLKQHCNHNNYQHNPHHQHSQTTPPLPTPSPLTTNTNTTATSIINITATTTNSTKKQQPSFRGLSPPLTGSRVRVFGGPANVQDRALLAHPHRGATTAAATSTAATAHRRRRRRRRRWAAGTGGLVPRLTFYRGG